MLASHRQLSCRRTRGRRWFERSPTTRRVKRAKKRYTLDRRLLRLADLASENEKESFGALERRFCSHPASLSSLAHHHPRSPFSSRSRAVLGFLSSHCCYRRIGNCKSTPWIMFLLLPFHLEPRKISCSTYDGGNLEAGGWKGGDLGKTSRLGIIS